MGEGVPSCDDPDANYHDVDVIVDPPWGAFQILPVGEGGDFQVRGANASLTDATVPPFPPEDFYVRTAERWRDGRKNFFGTSWQPTEPAKHGFHGHTLGRLPRTVKTCARTSKCFGDQPSTRQHGRRVRGTTSLMRLIFLRFADRETR